MGGGGGQVVVVSRDHSAVSIGDQVLGIGLGRPLAVQSVGVSSVDMVALGGEVGSGGGGVSGVIGGDGSVSVVDQGGVSLGGPLAIVVGDAQVAFCGQVGGRGGEVSVVDGGDRAIRVRDKLSRSTGEDTTEQLNKICIEATFGISNVKV